MSRAFVLSVLAALAGALVFASPAGAQSYSKGQPVSPAYEGWQQKPDGSYDMLFGYMNDNWRSRSTSRLEPTIAFLRLRRMRGSRRISFRGAIASSSA